MRYCVILSKMGLGRDQTASIRYTVFIIILKSFSEFFMEHTENKHIDEQIEEVVVAPVSEDESAKNQLLRLTADFANYRRRMDKERVEWVQIGQNAVVKAILPMIDDLERAFDAAKNAASQNDSIGLQLILDGLALVEKNTRKVFDDLGVHEVASTGMFNPELHEALMQTVVEGLEPGTIVQVLSKGYSYKGVVVRHAKVSVAA